MHSMREKTEEEIELLARARRLLPALRERSAQGDRELKVADESIAELKSAREHVASVIQANTGGGQPRRSSFHFNFTTIRD